MDLSETKGGPYGARHDQVYPWGNSDPTCNTVNYASCIAWTAPVGSYPSGKSALGLYDMAGNASEWVNDKWTCDLGVLPETDPVGDGTGRELRAARPAGDLCMRVSGNTVLITGGSSGIGLALARSLAALDNQVIICGRRREKLAEAKSMIPALRTKVCDVSKPGSRAALVRWATERFKSLNILVNNAGIQHCVDFSKGPRDLAAASAEVATNLTAPLELSAMLVPHLRRRKESAIVNVTSGLAFTPLASVPVYCATKAALHSLSMSIRHQLQGTSVRLFEVAPPMVATDLGGSRRERELSSWAMSAEEVADGIIDALANDRFEVALGGAAQLRKKRDALFDDMNG